IPHGLVIEIFDLAEHRISHGAKASRLRDGFDRCRSIRMRVGALPQHPTGLLGYALNWSPEGVVNEYLNDCEVIEGGVRKLVS
ncbi:hypothetical protein ACC754_42150, partial [Rhizobium johnstonii]